MTAPLNIILKSFHGNWGNAMVEEIFRGQRIGTCISINETATIPTFPAHKHLWVSPKLLREARYDDLNRMNVQSLDDTLIVQRHLRRSPTSLGSEHHLQIDWQTLIPLDEALMEKMYPCETMFLSMVGRYALHGDLSYAERKRQYKKHLRFWNHILETEHIGLFLLFNSPHQAYDYVIYRLCQLKGIPTENLEFCDMLNGLFVTADLERSAEELAPAYAKLQQQYADPSLSVPLSPEYETFFSAATESGAPLRPVRPEAHLHRKSFLRKWGKKALSLCTHRPMEFLKIVSTPTVWSRKLSQHRTARSYDAYAHEPDLSQPYIYVPLHMQPEDAVIPRGGAFRDQELIVQILAALLPPGVGIYVKEHPMQGELYRSETFYQTMKDLPSVTFVPRIADTFTLIRHAKAVATLTGTAGFEALFFGTPVIMFGHRFYQYAPGVFRVRSREDCRTALEHIFERGETPSPRNMRLFLKAVQDCSIPYRDQPQKHGALAEDEENVREVGKKIRKILSQRVTLSLSKCDKRALPECQVHAELPHYSHECVLRP